MKGSFTIGRLAGIDVGIHFSWILAFIVFTILIAQSVFPSYYPGWDNTTYWLLGIIATILLFICVLIHEFAHSIVARSRGLQVNSIVLFIFGGVSNIEGEPKKASTEFVMSIAGPLTSLVLGGIFYGMLYLSQQEQTPVSAIFSYLGLVNIMLAIFNIIPGFPMDGGRVLRSIIWGATGNMVKATNIAASIGRFFGWALIAFGIYLFLVGNIINGLWLAFTGWFLSSAADSARREATLEEELAGVKVKDVMDSTPECVSPGTSISEVVHGSFIQRGRRAVPVCLDRQIKGIVTLGDVKKVPQDMWDNTPVQQIMTSNPLESVSENDDLNAALIKLGAKSLNQIPVVREGHLVGLLSRADVIRYLQTRQELGIRGGKAGNLSSNNPRGS